MMKENWKRSNSIQMINIIDDELIIDIIEYSEELLKEQTSLKDLIKKQDFRVTDVKRKQISRMPIQALTIGWPYVMFAPLPNQIWIYNVFDSGRQHRIQIATNERYLEVIQSYITESKDLFFIAHEKSKYYVYKIDLDQSNYMENICDDFALEDQYKFEVIYEYDDDQVDKKILT
jgi:hypothetical protein